MQPPEVVEPHQRATTHKPVLVLNQNYEPLNVCNVHRAMRLVFGSKAEVLEPYRQPVRASRPTFIHRPSSALIYMIRRPRPRVKLTRREIFARDDHACQYCGTRVGDLTIDHVIPRSRGGQHSWTNLVTACRSCNHRSKAARHWSSTRHATALRTVRTAPRRVLAPSSAVRAP